MIYLPGGTFSLYASSFKAPLQFEQCCTLLEDFQNHFGWDISLHRYDKEPLIVKPGFFRSEAYPYFREKNKQDIFSKYSFEIIEPYSGTTRLGELITFDEISFFFDMPELLRLQVEQSSRSMHFYDDNVVNVASVSNTLMTRYAAMARFLIPRLQPRYLWAGEDDLEVEHTSYSSWPEGTFEMIYWLNYFGPSLLSPEQKALFENPPFGIVEHLPDGGLWYQLSEDFEQAGRTPEEFMQFEEQLVEHFAPLGVTDMKWKFFPTG
jgi:hypothetical protein